MNEEGRNEVGIKEVAKTQDSWNDRLTEYMRRWCLDCLRDRKR